MRLLPPLTLLLAVTVMPARAETLSPPPSDPPVVVIAESSPGQPVPLPLRPEDMQWSSPSGEATIRETWMLGGEQLAGPYVLRQRLAAGARVPVHRHPDDRVITVLAGAVFVGFGGIFDETRTVPLTAGTVFLIPADEPHYLWARDGEAELQANGFGPTGQRAGW